LFILNLLCTYQEWLNTITGYWVLQYKIQSLEGIKFKSGPLPLPTHQPRQHLIIPAIAYKPYISSCLNPAISLQPNSGRRLAVTRFPDIPSKADANLFAVAQRLAAQDVLLTKGKPTRDFSLI